MSGQVYKTSWSSVTFVDTKSYTAEASTIGLKPGEWPRHIQLTSSVPSQTKTFEFHHANKIEGELSSLAYHALDGTLLLVSND